MWLELTEWIAWLQALGQTVSTWKFFFTYPYTRPYQNSDSVLPNTTISMPTKIFASFEKRLPNIPTTPRNDKSISVSSQSTLYLQQDSPHVFLQGNAHGLIIIIRARKVLWRLDFQDITATLLSEDEYVPAVEWSQTLENEVDVGSFQSMWTAPGSLLSGKQRFRWWY